MLAPLTPHVGIPDARTHVSRVTSCHGVGATPNAAGRAGAPRPLVGSASSGAILPDSRSPIVGSGLFFRRDRLCRQAVDRACIHLHSNPARR